jgi:uncharacterized hydrophobic protein (TIGR00271 family)
MQLFYVTRDRFMIVHKDIADGSEPAMRFYIMVAVSTLIAAFGLVSNSTAVVIGAMLVAPLMTPIFGIALALVRGETGLLGHALRAEIMGVLAALAMSYILGSLLGTFEPTGEMLARTRPNLFDLLVAVLAGFAGAYALIDEKISPALPGVAIATAIVPPLANSGLCLALGEVEGGLGSFLLFFANFLSILLVASATFILSGMAKHYGAKTEGKSFTKRFGLPLVAFVAIAAFMGHSLVSMYEERRISRTIQDTMSQALAKMPSTVLGRVHYYEEEGKVQVMAAVHTPKFLTPHEVSQIQAKITKDLGQPSELLVHCVISNNVSAQGSVRNVIGRNLDGSFIKASDNQTLAQIAAAEQILREHFSEDDALDLLWVDLLNLAPNKVMLARVIGVRRLRSGEIALLQERIRKRTKDESIELVISSVEENLESARGPLRYGWLLGDKATPAMRQKVDAIRASLAAAFEKDTVFELVNVYATSLDNKLNFLLEISGPELYPRDKVELLQKELAQKHDTPLALYAWSRVEVVQGPDGPESIDKLQRYFQKRQKENLSQKIPLLLEAAGR